MQLSGPTFPAPGIDPIPTSQLRVRNRSVDIRLARIDALLEPDAARACREILSADELAQADAFARDVDRRRALLARALLRWTLSRHAPVAATEWRFRAGPHGKPEIAAPYEHELQFNVSHSGAWVACAVTRGGAIGIDLEDTARECEPLELGERVLAAEENRDLRELSGALRQRRFFEYWTLKEAWLKARGSGFALDPRSASFDLANRERIRARFSGACADDPARWQFDLLEPEPGQILALATCTAVPA